ncbi:uncharacterized protein LOC114449059 isoform X3 [Parambassis ranga]|uniref:Uncharacterized protein LOC114444144 isoform X3 n=1 Tax=Parambassis ranga TaxID=210632 RepID=A0A6P7JC15_9TELE|nr:uncharacterized protein LOC114444144 isoform X3 [Parambassis ranga]XP_028274354.1 uncharacterized protein LOC114444144 isoform X3 [Parambassis ranga]XP_028282203.1 uncharacterized protein LOC114449059 isoform X3 [Parambassis ranga]XP_028282204.1 uncharacterized protein LOC114449059 isoform X3 [Parambassis ranga]
MMPTIMLLQRLTKQPNWKSGRGVFAKGPISKGDFVVEYRGDMISDDESQRRRRLYHRSCQGFMFDFNWREKIWCIDASREDGSFGRLVNDDYKHPNCKMKKIKVNEKPHLCLFALNDIKEGEEITYDYGGEDYPWRTQTAFIELVPVATDDTPLPSLQETDIDNGTCPSSTDQQTAFIELVPVATDDTPLPSLQETDIDNGTCPSSTDQQTAFIELVPVATDDTPLPSLQETDIDNGTCPSSTDQQTAFIELVPMATDDTPLPSLQETDIDNGTCPSSTDQQFCNEDEIEVPRLRRTKSVIMKDIDLEDSPELYDTTSGSADDYIPDTTCESDSDTDTGLKANTRTTRRSLDEKLEDSRSGSSPVCDTTTPYQITADRVSLPSDDTEAEEEPSSSQAVNDCIVVSTCQKRGGKRVYDKRHYCLYCSKPNAKMARHLERAHQNKPDVAKAISFPKGSKERRKQLDHIRKKGNFAHNAAVIESGKGELVPSKRPSKEAQGNDFMHCAYCQGLFKRKVLWRHMRHCTLRPGSVATKPGKNRVQSMCTFTGPVPGHISTHLWKVISAMNPDPITDIIKSDRVIIDVGQHLLNKGGTSAKNQQNVREKMREMGRLINNARRVTTLKKMEDLINPKKYMETVAAVRATCGYDSETNKFMIPSLANKLGNTLVKVSKLLKAQGLISDNKDLVKMASDFQEVHQEKWNEMISATALRNIREAKWNVPTLMPFTEDVQKLHAYLSQVQEEWYKSLSENPSTKAWMELSKVCLSQIILFNRRREGEVASMPLSAFSSRDTSDPHEDVDWALSEVEKKLCRHFSRIIIRGKRGRPVPILLTPKMLQALELLVEQREASGVLKDNGYMFARPEAMTHFRGSDCLRGFAQMCGAKCPKSLTSTRLRKHAATLSTVLNMTDTEMDQLANFLGHDIRIHREFYRLPEKTLQLAKISKLLMALEQGRLAEFHGMNLDEIGIDPDEKVVDCDEEDRNIQEENCSSTVDGLYCKLDTEDTPLHTEGNEITPPPPKRCRPLPSGDATPSGDSILMSFSKGKTVPKKKSPWQQTEVQAVERHMKQFITSCIVPAKSDCEKCLRKEPEALKNRDWQNLKFYVYNRITAYKRKLQDK